jgi:hypothetical protein
VPKNHSYRISRKEERSFNGLKLNAFNALSFFVMTGKVSCVKSLKLPVELSMAKSHMNMDTDKDIVIGIDIETRTRTCMRSKTDHVHELILSDIGQLSTPIFAVQYFNYRIRWQRFNPQ